MLKSRANGVMVEDFSREWDDFMIIQSFNSFFVGIYSIVISSENKHSHVKTRGKITFVDLSSASDTRRPGGPGDNLNALADVIGMLTSGRNVADVPYHKDKASAERRGP